MRSRDGFDISDQCFAPFGLGTEFFCIYLDRLKPYWGHLEVLSGCCVELPPVQLSHA